MSYDVSSAKKKNAPKRNVDDEESMANPLLADNGANKAKQIQSLLN